MRADHQPKGPRTVKHIMLAGAALALLAGAAFAADTPPPSPPPAAAQAQTADPDVALAMVDALRAEQKLRRAQRVAEDKQYDDRVAEILKQCGPPCTSRAPRTAEPPAAAK